MICILPASLITRGVATKAIRAAKIAGRRARLKYRGIIVQKLPTRNIILMVVIIAKTDATKETVARIFLR